MKAAVLHAFGEAPHYEEFPDPVAEQGEQMVTVKAASLTTISKAWAIGSHYDGYKQLPVVCGLDGVGVLENGTRIYTGGSRQPFGMMAERTIVRQSFGASIPDAVDDVTAAALPNPALSSWLPLAYRAQLKPGETVFILGATGIAGKLAIQIAKHLGAGRIIAAGRNRTRLEALREIGADSVVPLDLPDSALTDTLVREALTQRFDVILDYIWGHPAEVLINALTGHDTMAENARIRYISIGSMAGPTAAVPSAALRSSGLELYGSGGGSVSYSAIFETFPKLWALAAEGNLTIETQAIPLADVEQAWGQQDTAGRRMVFIP